MCLAQILVGIEGQHARRRRVEGEDRRGTPAPGSYEGHLAHDAAGSDDVERDYVAGLGAHPDGEPAGLHHVEAVTGVTLGEELLALGEVPGTAGGQHP